MADGRDRLLRGCEVLNELDDLELTSESTARASTHLPCRRARGTQELVLRE